MFSSVLFVSQFLTTVTVGSTNYKIDGYGFKTHGNELQFSFSFSILHKCDTCLIHLQLSIPRACTQCSLKMFASMNICSKHL